MKRIFNAKNSPPFARACPGRPGRGQIFEASSKKIRGGCAGSPSSTTPTPTRLPLRGGRGIPSLLRRGIFTFPTFENSEAILSSSFIFSSLLIALACFSISCARQGDTEIERIYPESFKITVENTAEITRTDQAVILDIAKIQTKSPAFNPHAFVVFSGEKELASQTIDRDGDGKADQIIFVADFASREKKPLTVRFAKSGEVKRGYPQRTQAELSHKFGGQFVNREYQGGEFRNVEFLRVPPEHKDHSWYIRYEGPGWESDKVGYRFYLDWRNATDIFGKKTPEMALQNVGLDGFDSYHEMSGWGMDILKVGESLGIGSIAMWSEGKANRVAVTDSVTCAIVANGPVYSQIRTEYSGWKVDGNKYDLTSDLSITAGSRLTRHELAISGSPATKWWIPKNLCTGIVKLPDTNLLKKTGAENGWSYLATYGKQSLAEDNLGMAVLYKTSDLIEMQEAPHSHVVVLKPADGKLEYYFLAAWEKEPGGIQTEAQFVQYLEDVIAGLDSPIQVEF